MLRLAQFALIAILTAIISAADPAAAKQNWVTLGTFKIDGASAGSRTLTIGEAKGGFRELRILSDGPLTASRITVQFANTKQSMRVTEGNSLAAGKPFTVWTSAEPRVLASVGISWPASSTGAVTLKVEGLQDEGDTSLKVADEKPAMPGPAALPQQPVESARAEPPRTGAPRPAAAPPPAAPAPSKSVNPPTAGVAPSSRGFGSAPAPSAARPRTEREEGAQPAPGGAAPVPGVVAAAAGPGDVCIKEAICTPIPVFFGSSRNEVQGKSYVSFGYERPDKLTLGRTIVTVPKGRKPGEIPRPTTLEWLRGVPAEGLPSQHFTIPKNGVKIYSSEDAFLAEAKKHIAEAGDSKDHAFIYVHGFAVTFENAMYRAAQISYDLGANGKPFGTAFVYTWPSKGSILPTAYVYDGDSAEYAVPHFRKFVELVSQKAGVKNLHVIAHSMGNRVLMRALDEAVREGSPAWINQVILAAPDVDKQAFERLAKNIAGAARGLTLYASQQDNALRISRTIRGSGAPPRAGEVAPPAGPAIVTGIDTLDISALSTAYFLPDLDSHDKYADSPEMLNDIGKIFGQNKPAPEVRNSRFQKATFQALQYWRYVK